MVAITLVTVARAQSGIEHARAYAAPVTGLFSGSQLADSGVSASLRRPVASLQSGISGMALCLLPVIFIGLIAPLNLLTLRSFLSVECELRAPGLPHLFQRPPPTFA
jgi:hypothetical protein